MNKLILAAAVATSAILLSSPAAAQSGYGYQPQYQPYQQQYQPYPQQDQQRYQQRYQQYDYADQYANGGYGRPQLIIRPYAGQFQQRIQAAVQRGLFDYDEAGRMMQDLQSHLALEQQYAPLGITRSEERVLRERLQFFQRALARAERTGTYRQPRNPYGYQGY